MAIIYESWRADGNGQTRINWLRSDTRGFSHEMAAAWVAQERVKPKCVLITRGRTDKQSAWEKIIWQRSGYVDPCSKV